MQRTIEVKVLAMDPIKQPVDLLPDAINSLREDYGVPITDDEIRHALNSEQKKQAEKGIVDLASSPSASLLLVVLSIAFWRFLETLDVKDKTPDQVIETVRERFYKDYVSKATAQFSTLRAIVDALLISLKKNLN